MSVYLIPSKPTPILEPGCKAAGCELKTNGTHFWTNHSATCPRFKGRR